MYQQYNIIEGNWLQAAKYLTVEETPVAMTHYTR